MPKYRAPLDPECPEAKSYLDALFNDPMTHTYGAPVDEIAEGFERRHRFKCKRCREFGAANISVEY